MRLSAPTACLAALLLALCAGAPVAEAHAPSVKKARAVAKQVGHKIAARRARSSGVRTGRTRAARVRRCVRKPHKIRCGVVIRLGGQRGRCRVARVVVRFGASSHRVVHRYHTRTARCFAAPRRSDKRHRKPTTTSPSTPAPTTTPAAAEERLYSPNSVWNQPISSSAQTDPASPEMVAQVASEVDATGWSISTNDWTNTIYYADEGTPRYDVDLTTSAYSGRKLLNVPIPDGAQPSPDSDGGMVVIDRSTNCEYDIGRAQQAAGGGWSAWWANALPSHGTGIYPYSEAPSASGFASAAGMIRPHELEAGRIEHALAFTMKATKAGGPVLPATGSDGRSSLPGAIPEGARLQLDPNLNLDALGLSRHERVIAEALQRYGMFLVDTGGAVAIRVQNTHSTDYTYPWGRQRGRMPSVLARHLRVLETGPQYPITWRFVTNHCAQLSPR